MKHVVLDFDRLETPEQIQSYLAQILEAPSYYGGNLDALFDLLTDLCEETEIQVIAGIPDGPVSEYMEQVIKVLWDAQLQNENISVSVVQKIENEGIWEG